MHEKGYVIGKGIVHFNSVSANHNNFSFSYIYTIQCIVGYQSNERLTCLIINDLLLMLVEILSVYHFNLIGGLIVCTKRTTYNQIIIGVTAAQHTLCTHPCMK